MIYIKVKKLKELNIDFLSTIAWNEVIATAANEYKIPLICGVNNYNDALQAINTKINTKLLNNNNHHQNNNNNQKLYSNPKRLHISDILNSYIYGLKFYPGRDILPATLQSILYQLDTKRDNVIILVAGGITPSMISDYMTAGATHFCIGFDCQLKTVVEIATEIRNFNMAIYKHLN